MPRGRGIGWAFQSLAQGSTKRGFKPGRHTHLIQNGLCGGRAARFQYFRQRRHFGGDARACCAGLSALAACLPQRFGCCRARRFGFGQARRAFNQRGFGKLRGRQRGIARGFRNAFRKRGIAFRRKRSILRDNAAVAFISGAQGGFTARGFGTGFFSTAARIGVLCNSFGACGFGLFQSLPRCGESGFGLRHLLRRRRLFHI